MDARPARITLVPMRGMSCDLLKAIYAVMLTEIPWKSLRKFWSMHLIMAYSRTSRPKARSFLQALWTGRCEISPEYFWTFLRDLESGLLEWGIDGERFFGLVNHGPHQGPPVDPAWVLKVLPGPGSPMGTQGDPKTWLLPGLDRLLELWLPGTWTSRLPASPGAAVGEARFLFRPPGSRGVEPPDLSLFPGMLISALPRLFGWPAFDPVEVLADMRSPGRLAGRAAGGFSWKGDRLRHRGRTIGRVLPFGTFLEMRAGTVPGDPVPMQVHAWSQPVLLVDRDFLGDDGRRSVLVQGRAYGAPCSLLRIGSASGPKAWMRRAAATFLGLSNPRDAERPAQAMLDALHREFLDGWKEEPWRIH